MKFPEFCPVCESEKQNWKGYWIQLTDLDYDSDKESRIDDQIWECSNCHTLFRVRWELKSFTQLVEVKDKDEREES